MTPMTLFDCYTDGSFRKDCIKWAYAIVKDGEVIHKEAGKLPEKYNQYRQVAGELVAVARAVSWAHANNNTLDIYHDYTGVHKWVSDICEPKSKEWKRNNNVTQRYRKFIEDNSKYINKFVWVKGHNGNEWNEYVDQLMWND